MYFHKLTHTHRETGGSSNDDNVKNTESIKMKITKRQIITRDRVRKRKIIKKRTDGIKKHVACF